MDGFDIEGTWLAIAPVIVAVASAISALVPDDKLPKWLAAILNFAALNIGAAKNAERR